MDKSRTTGSYGFCSLFRETKTRTKMKLYYPRQKYEYRRLLRWKKKVNISNNFYKNFEED
jgi:hypothetical protein